MRRRRRRRRRKFVQLQVTERNCFFPFLLWPPHAGWPSIVCQGPLDPSASLHSRALPLWTTTPRVRLSDTAWTSPYLNRSLERVQQQLLANKEKPQHFTAKQHVTIINKSSQLWAWYVTRITVSNETCTLNIMTPHPVRVSQGNIHTSEVGDVLFSGDGLRPPLNTKASIKLLTGLTDVAVKETDRT